MAMQSPIDITRRALVPLAAGPSLRFRYPAAPVGVSVRFEVKDGDPVRGRPEVVPEVVVVPQEGEARVEVGAAVYLLQSLHWHTPSEHHLDGRSLPLELHLVHRRPEDGAFLVAGVLYRAGGAQPGDRPGLRPDRPVRSGDPGPGPAPGGGGLHAPGAPAARGPDHLPLPGVADHCAVHRGGLLGGLHRDSGGFGRTGRGPRSPGVRPPSGVGRPPHPPGNARRVQDLAGRSVGTDTALK